MPRLWLHSGGAGGPSMPWCGPSPSPPHRWPWSGLTPAPAERLDVHTQGDWRAALQAVRADLRDRPGVAGAPRWAALITYEAGALAEPACASHRLPPDLPAAVFLRFPEGTEPTPSEPAAAPLPGAAATAEPDDAEHLHRIARCRAAIGAGDLYQANLARRLTLRFDAAPDPLALARALQAREQRCYAACLELSATLAVVSLSPEALLRGQIGHPIVSSYPIKGTARPGSEALIIDPKEQAEHTMIVDLVRHDLGRHAAPGGVWVDPFIVPRDFRTLRHLESAVHARLAPGRDALDALDALLPGGSITGAPKIAATRLIADLEGWPRGPYTGALLAIDGAGRLAASLLIRTMVLREAVGTLHVGGGIVWASDPARELEETRRKARALLDGIADPIP